MLKRKLLDIAPFTLLLLVILAVLYGLDVFQPEPEKKQYKGKLLKVFIEPSKLKETQLFVYSQGEVKPRQQVELKSQVEGRIVRVAPELVTGGKVTKGQVLIEIDDSDYKLAVIQKEAKVAQSKQQYERVSAQAKIAKRELQALARSNANDLAKWLPQLKHAEAEVKAAQAALEQSQLALSRTKVTATFTGVVRKETVNIGQQINKNSSLAIIYANDVMEVSLAVNGEQLALLNIPIDYFEQDYEQGVDVLLTTQLGHQLLTWPARIVRTEGQFDVRTRTINLVAEIRQEYINQAILPGLYVDAKITGIVLTNVSTIKRTSLKTNDKVWYVDKKNTLQVQQVEKIYSDKDVVIVKGLKNNTKVVSSALIAPIPGVQVKPIKNKSATKLQQVIGKSKAS